MTLPLLLGLLAPWLAPIADDPAPSSPYAAWEHGPPADPGYFPIAVWLQDPKNAEKFQQAGINLYVGLWRGPTDTQLDQLHKAGMSVICGQNRVGLAHKDDPTIVGLDARRRARQRPAGRRSEDRQTGLRPAGEA